VTAGLWTAGHLTVDDVVFWDGAVRFGSAGGAALYAAIGAGLLGVPSQVATRLGRGYPCERLDRFAEVGVTLVPSPGEASIAQWVLYEEDGSRTYVLHPYSGSHEQMSPSPTDYQIPAASAVHVAPMPVGAQLAWCRSRAARSGVLTVDPHADSCASWPADVLALAAMTDAFLPSELEALALAGPDPVDAVEAFLRAGAPIAAVKLGSNGSVVGTPDGVWHIPVVPVDVVDVTGAGDSYCGAFAAALARGLDAVAAGCAATAVASAVVQVHGTSITSFPDVRREVSRRAASLEPELVARPRGDVSEHTTKGSTR
jgi:ribokinase